MTDIFVRNEARKRSKHHGRSLAPGEPSGPVRVGTPEDCHPMMALALAACAENGFDDPNPEKLLGEIWASLNRDRGIVGIIGEAGKPLEAAILLRIESLWYRDPPSIIERAIFVHPDFRAAKGGRSGKLCDFALECQKKLGMPLLIGVLSSQRTEAKVRLYERKFGAPAGAYWIVGATTGASDGAKPALIEEAI